MIQEGKCLARIMNSAPYHNVEGLNQIQNNSNTI
jgi:hypothetical protein